MPPLDHEQLNELLRLLKEGDLNALDDVLSVVGRRMFALARGIVKNNADAEDVIQISFLKIARGVHSFRVGTNGYAWIMRIVRNNALDFLRKKKRARTEDLDEFFHLTDERYSADRRQEALILEEALQKLSDADRRLIYFRYYLDFTVREIARELGVSKSAAGRALLAAENKLKEFLTEQEETEF